MTDYHRPQLSPPSLVDRAKAIILTPRTEWPRIDAEPATVGDIFRGYVVPLAAIGPVAGLIGGQLFGYGMFGISYKPGLVGALVQAAVSYGLTLLGTYVLALIVDALAPTFGGTKNPVQAYKVAAYSATAGWLAGIFGLIPALGFLMLLGLYSFYLFWLGLPVLMRVSLDRRPAYAGTVFAAAVVIFLVIGAVAGAVTSAITPAPTAEQVSGTVSVPGMGTIDVGKLEQAAKDMEASAKQAQSGVAPAVGSLQAMLPASVAGLARTGVESSSANAGGVGGSSATATYGEGDRSVRLSITDMGAMGGLAALGSAFNVNTTKEDAAGYEKTATVDGRMTNEKWRKAESTGEYSTVVGNRFLVAAEGGAPSIDALKAAVAGIDLGRLEAMAKP